MVHQSAWRGIATLLALEIARIRRDRARIFGMVGLPLVFWVVFGSGFRSVFHMPGTVGGLDYMTFIYPGAIAMAVLFGALFSGISVIVERERGFLKEVLVAPVPSWSVSVGMTLAKSINAFVQGVLLVLMAPLAGVSLSVTGIVVLLAMVFLIAFSMASLGVALALRMDSVEGFHNLANFLLLPLFFLSGALFPIQGAPVWMGILMKLDPLSYAVDALRHILHANDPFRTDITYYSMTLNLAVVLLFGLAMTVFGTASFVRRSE